MLNMPLQPMDHTHISIRCATDGRANFIKEIEQLYRAQDMKEGYKPVTIQQDDRKRTSRDMCCALRTLSTSLSSSSGWFSSAGDVFEFLNWYIWSTSERLWHMLRQNKALKKLWEWVHFVQPCLLLACRYAQRIGTKTCAEILLWLTLQAFNAGGAFRTNVDSVGDGIMCSNCYFRYLK